MRCCSVFARMVVVHTVYQHWYVPTSPPCTIATMEHFSSMGVKCESKTIMNKKNLFCMCICGGITQMKKAFSFFRCLLE